MMNKLGKPMRILFVGNTAWSMQNFRFPVMKTFCDKGYEVAVAAPCDGAEVDLAKSFRFFPLKFLKRKGANPFADLLFLFELIALLLKIKPDNVFFYTVKPNVYGSLAAKLFNIKSFCMVPGLGNSMKRRLTRIPVKLLYTLAYLVSFRTIFLNEDDKAEFLSWGKLLDPGKAVVFPGEGIDLDTFSPRESLERDKSGLSFLYLGRLLSDKGIREFIEAARLAKQVDPSLRFRILGPIDDGNPNGISKSELDRFVADGIVEYLGVTRDVRPTLDECSCVVLPTYYGEGLSRAALEAMAMGKPVIAADNPGTRPLVRNGVTGFICKPKDVSDLKNKILFFRSMSLEEGNVLANNALNHVTTNFSMDAVVSRYLGLVSPNN